MINLTLDLLEEGLPGITKSMGAYYAEAARVCLVEHGHKSGVRMDVKGDYEGSFRVHWNSPVTEEILIGWNNKHKAREYGALAIAILLVLYFTDFDSFKISNLGSGIDFWLGKAKERDLHGYLFRRHARVEISGIGKETRGNSMAARIRLKRNQMESSDDTNLPGFIIVIEFNTPKSKIVFK